MTTDTATADTISTAQRRAFAAVLLYRPERLSAQRHAGHAASVSPSRQAATAAAYAAAPMFDPAAVPAYAALREETWRQLDALQAAGLSVSVTDADPYTGPAELFADVARGHVAALSTRSTGGHPLWSDVDNDAFRLVHDVMGHTLTGRGFDRHGEEAAYRAHAALYSPLARRALATETRGQNAALIASGGAFAPQKVALLPEPFDVPRFLAPTRDESAAALADARARHAAWNLPASF